MSDRPTPIHSTRSDDVDLLDAVSDFVVGLAERVDLLQDAESAGDFEELRALSVRLAEEAAQYGYPALSEAAGRIRGACDEAKADQAQQALVDLTDIARRIRLGHRGAA
jgi:hypothetical protein